VSDESLASWRWLVRVDISFYFSFCQSVWLSRALATVDLSLLRRETFIAFPLHWERRPQYIFPDPAYSAINPLHLDPPSIIPVTTPTICRDVSISPNPPHSVSDFISYGDSALFFWRNIGVEVSGSSFLPSHSWLGRSAYSVILALVGG
jgi:hypothetical protein